MPKTLFGKALFCLVYSAGFTTLMLNGLEAWSTIDRLSQENEKSKTTERGGENENVQEHCD